MVVKDPSLSSCLHWQIGSGYHSRPHSHFHWHHHQNHWSLNFLHQKHHWSLISSSKAEKLSFPLLEVPIHFPQLLVAGWPHPHVDFIHQCPNSPWRIVHHSKLLTQSHGTFHYPTPPNRPLVLVWGTWNIKLGGRNTHQAKRKKKGDYFVCRTCVCAAGIQVSTGALPQYVSQHVYQVLSC